MRSFLSAGTAALISAACFAAPALAQDGATAGASAGVGSPTGTAAVAAPSTTGSVADSGSVLSSATPATPSIQSLLGPYGDPGGIRAKLESKGITYNFTYIGETLGNPYGGYKQGATFEGRLDMQADVDLEKLAGIKNAALHAQAFQIHGRGLTGNNTLDLFTVSNIEAFPSTKLYEAWYEQKFDDGKIFVRLGQLAADTEFVISQTATLFVNSTFGFPAILANDLPSGGPAYPLATPGARVKYAPNDKFTLLGALFNGNPAGPYHPGINDFLPQLRDPSGTNFRLKDGPLLLVEGQYAYNQGKDAKGLPGTIKVGYGHLFGGYTVALVPIGGVLTSENGNDFGYAIIDQVVYRKPGTDDQGASVFARVSGAPSDRNLIDLYVDAGISFKGLIPGRPDDTFGFSGAYARISPPLATVDLGDGLAPLIRDENGVIEATYQYVVAPGFTLQPDFQYLFHPSGHSVAIPNIAETIPLHNAAVFGLRATVHY